MTIQPTIAMKHPNSVYVTMMEESLRENLLKTIKSKIDGCHKINRLAGSKPFIEGIICGLGIAKKIVEEGEYWNHPPDKAED